MQPIFPVGPDCAVVLVTLSLREAELLRLLCEGHANKQIAFRLALTDGTAKQYVFRLAHRLGLSTRQELMIWALQHPAALGGSPVPRALHQAGCRCGAIYCVAMAEAVAALDKVA